MTQWNHLKRARANCRKLPEKGPLCYTTKRLGGVCTPNKGDFLRLQSMGRKNPRAHRNKIGTCTPPLSRNPNTPPLKRGILWAWGFSSRKNQKCQAPIKLAQPFPARELRVEKLWGKSFLLAVGAFCLQLSFFAYSPLRLLSDALSHCKQKAPTVSKDAKTVSEKAPIVSKKAKIVNCK